MREVELFVAGRGRHARDAERALSRAFRVRPEPVARATRIYHDTFDGRLYRAGLELMAVGDQVSLRDASTSETVVQGSWAQPDGPRFARDLLPSELRERVASVVEPRVLEETMRARVVSREAVARDAAGVLVARLRFEAVSVRRGGGSRTINAVFVTTPKEARRTKTAVTLRSALAAAGYRPTTRPWPDRLLVAAGRDVARYRPAPRPRIDRDATVQAAAIAVLPGLFATMVRNEPGVRKGVDPEFLHDYRVALRRTRTGLRELASVFSAEETRAFRSGFAALSAPTGRVRDLDVQLSRAVEYARWVPSAFPGGIESVIASLASECEAAREELLRALASRSYANLKRDWKRALAGLATGRPAGVGADEPALPVALAAITKRYARLRTIAASVDTLDDAALHRARVQSKRLRYLMEFFARPLGGDAEEAIAAVERLQDALGEFHDANVQIATLDRLARATQGGSLEAVARAAALGAVMARLEGQRTKARRRSTRRLLALAERKQARVFERVLNA